MSDEFPDCLVVEGKMYTGSEVLRGFKEMAYAQSRKEMMFVDDIPEEFTMIKKFNETYRKLIEEDDKEIRWISDEEIMKEVKKVRDNKAPDLANFGKENVTKNSKYIEGIFCGFVRDMCEDPTRYSSLLTSLSVASFLYKGKNKNREDPTSYRKISIGSFYNKITDKIFAEETQRCAKENQPPLQYGFTSGVNFLLCSVLRESLIRKAVKEKKAPLLLACDVKNAFSKTSRECQMYELYNAGERSKIWKYSQHTYLNTYTVLKHGKEYSDMVEEMCGSKQGGVKSAVDYKSFNSPLFKLIQWSGLGLEVNKRKFGCVIVADDALSISNTIPEMKGIIDLYDYFAKIYSVTYCSKKTIINRFGSKSDKEELENSDIQVDGVRPNFDKESVHLGLWLSEDLGNVAEINVTHRIKKTDGKLFGHMRNIIWDRTGLVSLETKLQLYKTLLRPSLLSGLNALCIDGKQLQRLIQWEHWIMREIFKTKENASVWGLYINSGLLPIEGHLHKSMLSLFYNAWTNRNNPAVQIIKETMNEKEHEGFWATHLKKI